MSNTWHGIWRRCNELAQNRSPLPFMEKFQVIYQKSTRRKSYGTRLLQVFMPPAVELTLEYWTRSCILLIRVKEYYLTVEWGFTVHNDSPSFLELDPDGPVSFSTLSTDMTSTSFEPMTIIFTPFVTPLSRRVFVSFNIPA